MENLRAYQNCTMTKTELVDRMQAHYDADEILKGATGEDGKGCTVWCALNDYDHEAFPETLGLPVWLAKLLDQIFESLPAAEARQFSQDWPKAIAEGADLTLVKNRFLHALLVDPEHGVIRHAQDSTEILAVAALHQRAIDGETVSDGEWQSAAARAAARAAAEALWAAAEALWAAAEAAAKAAWVAAWAAAEAEVWDAWAAWAWQRDLLLGLLRSAPISPTPSREIIPSAIGSADSGDLIAPDRSPSGIDDL